MYDKLFLSVVTFLLTTSVYAQTKGTYEISKSRGTIHVEGINDLEVEGYDGNKIIITAKSYKEKDNTRAAGLSAINSKGAKDNTGIGLSVTEDNGVTIITPIVKHSGDYVMKVPKGMAIGFSHSTYNMKKVYMHGLTGEITVDLNYGSVELKEVSGPLSVNTVYGKIEAVLTSANTTSPSTLYSVYGLVDVTLPSSTKADIHLSSSYGNMLTDFDITVPANSKISSSEVRGTINGGGTEWRINSTYQNIYLRKG
jgi:hypothetical protein